MGSVDNPFNPVSLALGAEATFVARAMDCDRAELTGILRAAAEHRGTALVEIYQNCPIFNDGAFEVLKDRSQQEARIVRLARGEPVTVGAEGDRKVLVRKGSRRRWSSSPRPRPPAARRVRSSCTTRALEDPSQAFQLSRLDTPEMTHVPMGIFRQVARPTYDDLVRDQVERRRRHRGRPGHRRRPRTSCSTGATPGPSGDLGAPAGDGGGGSARRGRRRRGRRGTVYGFLAYGIWGLFPLYFAALKPAGAFEILGHRILWTLAVCALVLLVRRDLGWIRPFVARPRLVAGITIAALLIATNWMVYVARRAHRPHLRGGAGLLPQPHRHGGAGCRRAA